MSVASHLYMTHAILIGNKITSKKDQIYHILLNTGLPEKFNYLPKAK